MKNGTLKESATSIAVNQWFISHIRNEDPALAVLAWFPIGVENIEGGKCSLKCCGGSLSQYMEGAWKDFHERENILLILILYRVRWKCYFTYSLSAKINVNCKLSRHFPMLFISETQILMAVFCNGGGWKNSWDRSKTCSATSPNILAFRL